MNPFQTRKPTHKALDMGLLIELCETLIEESQGEPVTTEMVTSVSEETGHAEHVVWCAVGAHPMLHVAREHPIAVAICTGKCQEWGAGELLQEALKIAENRLAAGKVGVDVIPRSCLNRCHDAPMVMAMIEEGAVPLPRCGEEALLAALAEIDAMRAQP